MRVPDRVGEKRSQQVTNGVTVHAQWGWLGLGLDIKYMVRVVAWLDCDLASRDMSCRSQSARVGS